MPMLVGRRFERFDFWLAAAAVALAALVLGGRGTNTAPEQGESAAGSGRSATSTAEGPGDEPHRLSDAGRIDDQLLPVGFRSRAAAEPQADPEVSLGTEVEAPGSGPATVATGASPAAQPTATLPPGAAPQQAGRPPQPNGPPASAGLAPASDRPVMNNPLRVATRLPQLDTAVPPAQVAGSPVLDDRQRLLELETIARQADALVRQGYRLAERGAVYAARQHFLEAIALVARSLDLAGQNQEHSRALAEGNTALVESRQLAAPAGVRVDLARIVAAHRTPVLKAASLDALSPVVAQQRYLTFAQERLTLAAGGWPAASLALYALGKSAPQMQPAGSLGSLAATGEQMACYQAALAVNPQNYLAANELGVILAESGRLEAARELFASSVAISEHAATWQNLAQTLTRLGDSAGASRAAARAEALRAQRPEPVTGDNVRWVDPATFAKNPSATDSDFPPAVTDRPAAAQSAAQSATQPAALPQKKRTAMFPWSNKAQR